MKCISINPLELLQSLWLNRDLIISLTKRDILSRYKGSIFGLFWSFFQPVVMLSIYTFVFSVIFEARWNISNNSKTEFALVLFAGLIVFNFFSECLLKAPNLVLSQPNYVKKVIFPLEILPWISIGSALFHLIINIFVWLLCYIIVCGMPYATSLLLPLIILPIILIALGLSWILSSLGVYFRDVGYAVSIFTTILTFLSPIFYPISSIPKDFQFYLKANPLTPAIEGMRNILYWGSAPNFLFYSIFLFLSAGFAWLGFVWFQKTRKGFADVL